VAGRTFIVTVTDSPPRAVIEDVRSGRRAVTRDTAMVGREIALLIDAPLPGHRARTPLEPDPSAPARGDETLP